MKRILNLSFIPVNTDFALLLLRVWLGIGLFAKHGIEKFENFDKMKDHFLDPVGVGQTTSFLFALVADGICSVLVLLGAGTRIASLFIVINLLVVFTFMHHFSFSEKHAEMVYVYLGSYLAIFIAGPGKYSIDRKLLLSK